MTKYCLVFYCCIIAIGSKAQQDTGQQVLSKSITKLYECSEGEGLFILNQYGDVDVRTWDKKQVKAVVTMVAKADDKAGAANLLNRVSIFTQQDEGAITLITKITGEKEADYKLPQPGSKCSVNYVVYLPQDMPLNIKNRFGNISLGNYAGVLAIDESFGTCRAGILTGKTTFNLLLASLFVTSLRDAAIGGHGFGIIKIDTIAGNVDCGLSAGKQLDAGFAVGSYRFMLKSDNIKLLNFRLPPNFDAVVTVHGIFSTVENKSAFLLKPAPPPDNSTTSPVYADTASHQQKEGRKSLMAGKLKLEADLIKKSINYYGLAGHGKAVLNIATSLSKLTFY